MSKSLPADVPARITADSRYVLWVNDREVGRGPARSQPYRQRYDSYDLAPYLAAGRNVIAVLVTYYGRPMSFWQPAPAGSNTDAALVFEAQLGDQTLASDRLAGAAIGRLVTVGRNPRRRRHAGRDCRCPGRPARMA